MKFENQKRLWKIEFTVMVVLTAILSGIAYFGQNYYFANYVNTSPEIARTYYNIVRSFRMILLYVFPVFIFTRRWSENFDSLGFKPKQGYILINLFAGILLYSFVGVIFVNYQIFFNSWIGIDGLFLWFNFILVGLMASITDFWTRGFILFTLAKKTSEKNAIFWQNITWFVIHIYEIELLIPFIGLLNSILLTLLLGIGGDLIALRTKSIFGLMLGHVTLNLIILMAAKDILLFTLL